ncbi:PHO85 cyclin-1 [Plectosphaerella plurivora]|uniref:PHO85 cyclin-1 n=1 Tax=Plectosphaerella plurivora TaxID=936078 RepID=A0A9P8V8I1_9PEZI|nr:PHO85 cyclin-1 [Plectosphaerella plurivora]
MAELNAAALDTFVYQPVSKQMIAYLAGAAFNVIACDSHLMPPGAAEAHRRSQLPPTPPRTPEPREVRSEDADLPTLEAFITQLVVSSNVQVPTLMSTLVYLGRLKSKLQPMARGLRCTTHRIFLASLILSAKYLNDSSPKNKHWAAYTNAPATDYSSFGFSKSEVNLMERQLLLLLDWDLRISEEDLYCEFEPFLAPIREQVQAKHTQRVIRRRRAQDERRQLRKAQDVADAYAAAAAYPSPASSRDNSRSRPARQHSASAAAYAEHHARSRSTASSSSLTTPPPLVHTNSYSSSYAADAASIRSHARSIRAVTPPDAYYADADPQVYVLPDGSLYDSPVEVAAPRRKDVAKPMPAMLPYEISADDYAEMHYASSRSKKARFGTSGRSMLDRFLGAVTVR